MWRRSFFATLTLSFALTGGAAAFLAPKAYKELAEGVAEGFVSDDNVLAVCGQDAGSTVGDFEQAGKDLIQGVLHLNLTALADGVRKVVDGLKEIPVAKAACKEPLHDMEAILAVVKSFKGTEDAVDHIIHNMFTDGDKIFSELSAIARFGRTNDYLDAGKQIGMALRRTLVGESAPKNGTKPTPPGPPGSWKSIAIGVAVGFVSDDSALVTCAFSGLTFATDLKEAGEDLIHGLLHHNLTQIAEGLKAVARVIKTDAPDAKVNCGVVLHDVEDILRVLKQYHGAEDAIDHIVHNIMTDSEKIFGELGQMEKIGKTGDYIDAGTQLGMALRRMLVGEDGPAPSPPSPPSPACTPAYPCRACGRCWTDDRQRMSGGCGEPCAPSGPFVTV